MANDGENWGVGAPNSGNMLIDQPSTSVDSMPEIDETPIERIAKMLGGDLDDQASIRVYRMVGGHSHKLEWCANYTPAQFEAGDLAMLRAQWGAGDYQLRIYGRHPISGRVGILGKEDISIAVDPTAIAAPVFQQQQQTSEVSAVLKSLAESQAAMMQQLAARPDPMQGIQQAVALMTSMQGLLNPGGNSPKSQLSEIVGAMRELRSVSEELNPPKPGDSGDSGGLMAMGAQVLEMIRAAQANRAPADVPLIAAPPTFQGEQLPLPTMQNPIQPQQAPEIPAEDQMSLLSMIGHLRQLVLMAEQKQPTQTGAQLIFDKVPDQIIDMMELPNWFDLLCQFEPKCKEHVEWFKAAHAQAMALFDADSDNNVPA